jgi:hypothetical protein
MINIKYKLLYIVYVSVLLYTTVPIYGEGFRSVEAFRHFKAYDFRGDQAKDSKGNMKIFTLDHARMGHMDRYLDLEGFEDEWANTTDMPSIKEYRNTHALQQIRDLKYEALPKHIHDQWDHTIRNVTEISHEMYSQYIVNEWTGQLMTPNTSWIMIFIEKNHNMSYGLCSTFEKMSGALNEAGF